MKEKPKLNWLATRIKWHRKHVKNKCNKNLNSKRKNAIKHLDYWIFICNFTSIANKAMILFFFSTTTKNTTKYLWIKLESTQSHCVPIRSNLLLYIVRQLIFPRSTINFCMEVHWTIELIVDFRQGLHRFALFLFYPVAGLRAVAFFLSQNPTLFTSTRGKKTGELVSSNSST